MELKHFKRILKRERGTVHPITRHLHNQGSTSTGLATVLVLFLGAQQPRASIGLGLCTHNNATTCVFFVVVYGQ